MQIEHQTQEILNHLSRLRDDYRKFEERFLTLGKHLTNMRSAYEDSEKRLHRFSDKLLKAEQPLISIAESESIEESVS